MREKTIINKNVRSITSVLDPPMENSEAETEDGILHENLDLENNIFNIFDPEGLKLLTRLLLGFSHLNEHRFTLHRIDVMNNVKSI